MVSNALAQVRNLCQRKFTGLKEYKIRIEQAACAHADRNY